ncbi:hypothetical protein ANPL_04560 [Anaplasma platys]|uniref:Uncharacterized protein n=1 Tax=Anaplasma platys TaxID=949 RepID=A0A858PZC6_9RICK|nr:hypothetical protein ANPL_04560 [Anaplasma platys]
MLVGVPHVCPKLPVCRSSSVTAFPQQRPAFDCNTGAVWGRIYCLAVHCPQLPTCPRRVFSQRIRPSQVCKPPTQRAVTRQRTHSLRGTSRFLRRKVNIIYATPRLRSYPRYATPTAPAWHGVVQTIIHRNLLITNLGVN